MTTIDAYIIARDAISDIAHAARSPSALAKRALSALDDLYWDTQDASQDIPNKPKRRTHNVPA